MPIAVEPFLAESSLVLSPFQWSLYALSCLFFAYAEGYKGFHKKFAPLVVKRSFTLVIGTPQGNNVLNYFLAPLYSMGFWGATKKTTHRLVVHYDRGGADCGNGEETPGSSPLHHRCGRCGGPDDRIPQYSVPFPGIDPEREIAECRRLPSGS